MPSPSDTYPHDIPADFFDPLRTLYHPPDEAASPDEIEAKKRILLDNSVTRRVTLG